VSFHEARRAYENREPREATVVAPVSRSTTLDQLATLIDEHGVVGFSCRVSGDVLIATAKTRDADGEGRAPMKRDCALADALREAIGDAVESQREIDGSVGQ